MNRQILYGYEDSADKDHGSLRAVSAMLAVGISFTAEATSIPRAEKARAPTIIAITNRRGLAMAPPVKMAAPDAVTSESRMPKAEPAKDFAEDHVCC